MSDSWSRLEIELIVSDYITMLLDEIQGRPYNKSEHRRTLSPLLNGRVDGSIERKHQNISAILIAHGYPYINGYKPLPNYQRKILPEVVLDCVEKDTKFISTLEKDLANEIASPDIRDILSIYEEAPEVKSTVRSKAAYSGASIVRFKPSDFVTRESQNRKLGLAGELLILEYERARLFFAGKDSLADRIEHTSVILGDGAGYDVRSYNTDGSDRFIEVKTTKFGRDMPFYISRNEVFFSESHFKNYNLYRVYNFRTSPKMFAIGGSIEKRFSLEPISYRAYLQ